MLFNVIKSFVNYTNYISIQLQITNTSKDLSNGWVVEEERFLQCDEVEVVGGVDGVGCSKDVVGNWELVGG